MVHSQAAMELSPTEILAGLSRALLAERQAVADYDVHARTCQVEDIRQALGTLCDVEREHAHRLAERIAALGGTLPVAAPDVPAPVGSIVDWLTSDLRSEQWAIVEYASLVAAILSDDETAALFANPAFEQIDLTVA